MKSLSEEIQLCPLTLKDIPFAMKLKSNAGWNQRASDWEFLIKAGKGGNFIARYNGQKAGTVTTLTYTGKFSWIGMVLVEPDFRGRGIGTALLKAAVKFARKKGTVRLDATPQGKNLYETLEFKTERDLLRLEISKSSPVLTDKCSKITNTIMEKLVEFDAPIFGAARESLLWYLFHGSPNYAFYIKRNERISGYCLGRSGSNFEQIGPVIAESNKDAKKLLTSALDHCQGKPVIVDVFTEKVEWLNILKTLGFGIQRRFIRMYQGKLNHTGIPEKQYAIAGPELG